MGMDQYLLIPFLGGWTPIYQLFWCELQGYKVLTHCHMVLFFLSGQCFFQVVRSKWGCPSVKSDGSLRRKKLCNECGISTHCGWIFDKDQHCDIFPNAFFHEPGLTSGPQYQKCFPKLLATSSSTSWYPYGPTGWIHMELPVKYGIPQ